MFWLITQGGNVRRDYKKKMEKYRMNPERYKELRRLCKRQDFQKTVRKALNNDKYYGLEEWLFLHTTDRLRWRSSIAQLQSEGLPCCEDTFRVYRAKFYYNLELIYYGNHEQAVSN